MGNSDFYLIQKIWGITVSEHRVRMPPQDFAKEAIKIVEAAQGKNIYLRIMGALGVYIGIMNNEKCLDLYKTIGRFSEGEFGFTDLDLVAYGKQRNAIEKFFKELSFKPDDYVNAMFSDRRLIFYHPNQPYSVDIFFSPLEFSHIIDLGKDPEKGRLKLSFPTLPLSDMVLLKLQIHDINRKDLADLAVIFSCYPISEQEEHGKINVNRIVEVLSDDWGFWYDATNNLKLLKNFLGEFLEKEHAQNYHEKIKETIKTIEELEHKIESSQKTKNWLKRAKIGTSKRWYNVVEEI